MAAARAGHCGGHNVSKGQYLSNYQQGIVRRYYDNIDTLTLNKLQEAISDLAVAEDGPRLASMWQNVHRHLKKTPADQMRVGKIVATRDVAALASLVEEISKGGAVVAQNRTVQDAVAAAMATGATNGNGHAGGSAAAGATNGTASRVVSHGASEAGPKDPKDPAVLKGALTAFKKRFKVTKLDQESKLSRRAMTGGQNSGLMGIMPPAEYPRAVWEELKNQGKIKYVGDGMYTVVDGV
jgi:hypothetical protein